MKIVSSMAVLTLAYFTATAAAKAGVFPDVGDKALAAQAQQDPDNPDSTSIQAKEATEAAAKAYQKRQDAAAKNKDWLIRSYEHQLRINSTNKPGDQSTNLYYQLSADKNLAKLAGISTLDDDDTAPLHTGNADSGKNALALRTDISPTDEEPPQTLYQSTVFKPLITPLSAPAVAGLHNFYSSTPFTSSAPASFYGSDQPVAPASRDENSDSTDIATPGLTAAEKDPLLDKSEMDLNLDVLPGESVPDNRPHVDDSSPLQLPLSTDLDRMTKQQDVALSVPGSAKKSAPAAARINPLLLDSPNDEAEPDKVPPPNPVRSPIADPFDIFYR